MMMFDVCVVGAGIEGSATAQYLSSREKKTLLLEQFPLPHTRGSSHGQSRITRYGYRQPFYAALMPSAFRKWAQIERKAKKQLFRQVGMLSVEDPPYSEMTQIADCVRKYGNECEILSADEIRTRFRGLAFSSKTLGAFEPKSGVLFADTCLRALQDQFVESGGTLRDGEKVLEIKPGPVITIRTSKGTYQARKLIFTAGPWTNDLLKPLGLQLPLAPWRINVCYWEIKIPGTFSADSGFPCMCYYYADSKKYVYAIPAHEYPNYIKVCADGGVQTTADDRDAVRHDESLIDFAAQFIREHFIGVHDKPGIVESCLYTCTPDRSFIIDRHPSFNNIVIGAGFSGHGFKLAPVVGELLSKLALEETISHDLEPFRISRFDRAQLKASL